MKKLFSTSKLMMGFIAGVAFMASCGGDYSNQANAYNIKHQLFCDRVGSNTLLNHAYVDEVSAMKYILSCIDSMGNTYYRTNLEELYKLGWKIQLISNNKEYVFFK